MDAAPQPAEPTTVSLTPSLPGADDASSAPRHDVHWFFLGPHGLRAGWSVLLFALIFLCTDFLAGWALRPLLHKLSHGQTLRPGAHDALPVSFGLAIEAVQASGMFVATIVMAFLERRSILAYGYQGKARAVRFLSGLVYGFLAITTVVFILWKIGFLAFDGQLLHGAELWKDAAGWAVFFLLVGVFEESLLRGYLQFTLTRGIGFWWGALLFSFFFGFSHGNNPGETPVGLFSAGAIGLVFCLSLWYTGSLWWAVGFHAAWDWGESYFYGTSDSGLLAQGHLLGEHPLGKTLWSGGDTGPEGSLIVLPVIAIIATLMWLWWRRRAETPFRGYAWKPAPVETTGPPSLLTAP